MNIDGLPLFKGSRNELWPILSCAKNYPVFLVAVYFGIGKPNNVDEFMKETVDELIYLVMNGFDLDSKIYDVEFHSLICDLPAKSYVLKIKGHAGYSSCIKCKIDGKYFENRVCFPEIHAALRTMDEFVRRIDANFHIGLEPSPLLRVPGFDVTKHAPNDCMHSVYLGIVKKMLPYSNGGENTL